MRLRLALNISVHNRCELSNFTARMTAEWWGLDLGGEVRLVNKGGLTSLVSSVPGWGGPRDSTRNICSES